MVFSKNARIFLFENSIDLNGKKGSVVVYDSASKVLFNNSYVKIKSPVKGGEFTHGGVYLGDNNSSFKDAVLATGKPLEGALSYKIPVENYRMSETHIVTNSFFSRDIVVNSLTTPNFIRNSNIDDIRKIIAFNQTNLMFRTMINGPIFLEKTTSRDLILKENNYSCYALKNRVAFSLSNNQIKIYDYSINVWESFSDEDRNAAISLLKKTNINFNNYDYIDSPEFKYLTKGFFVFKDDHFIPSSLFDYKNLP